MIPSMSTLGHFPASAHAGPTAGIRIIEGGAGLGARHRNYSFGGQSGRGGCRLPIEVRFRMAGDLPACVDGLRLVHISDGYPALWPVNPENWVSPDQEHLAWVATDANGSIRGHIALHRVHSHAACHLWSAATGLPPRSLAAVARLFVVPSARRRGVGRTLLDVAAEHACALHLRPVLDVGQDNPAAVRLYEQRGWQRVGRLDMREIPIFVYTGPANVVPVMASR